MTYSTVPDSAQFPRLKNQVVVVTGGASGIGLALVELLHQHGAQIVFGDIDREAGLRLAETLSAGGLGTAQFVPCDVTRYQDIYALFKTALATHGRVDHVVACAGIAGSAAASAYFGADVDVDNASSSEGDLRTVEVNFLGSCFTARIALPFLRHARNDENGGGDRSLTFVSSVTAFRDVHDMCLYKASKESILGLMRSMRSTIFARDQIRVNAICPGMTETSMTKDFIHLFRDNTSANLSPHYQSAGDVSKHIAALILAPELNGRSVYIEEGQGWEFEDGLTRCMPDWLGEEPKRLSDDNLKFFESLNGV